MSTFKPKHWVPVNRRLDWDEELGPDSPIFLITKPEKIVTREITFDTNYSGPKYISQTKLWELYNEQQEEFKRRAIPSTKAPE